MHGGYIWKPKRAYLPTCVLLQFHQHFIRFCMYHFYCALFHGTIPFPLHSSFKSSIVCFHFHCTLSLPLYSAIIIACTIRSLQFIHTLLSGYKRNTKNGSDVLQCQKLFTQVCGQLSCGGIQNSKMLTGAVEW